MIDKYFFMIRIIRDKKAFHRARYDKMSVV
jgi:hypothetical protein